MLDKVFTYGTLRRGEWNHIYLENQKFIQRDSLLGRKVTRGIPYLFLDGDEVITGEVYEVTPECLLTLDHLEGVSYGHYERIEHTLASGVKAWVYVGGPEARERFKK